MAKPTQLKALRCATTVSVGLTLAFFSASGAGAQSFGDAKRGGSLARDICSECHAVEPGQRSSNQAAPTFETIAGTAGMTGLALEAALQSTPHSRQMPNVMLSAPDRADIIAYIEGLRAKK